MELVLSNKCSSDSLNSAITRHVFKGDLDTRLALHEALLASILLLPTPMDVNELKTSAVTNDSSQAHVRHISNTDSQGRHILNAFTDESALLVWAKSPCNYIVIRGCDLLKVAVENGVSAVLLNPAGPVGVVVEEPDRKST